MNKNEVKDEEKRKIYLLFGTETVNKPNTMNFLCCTQVYGCQGLVGGLGCWFQEWATYSPLT